MRFRFPRAVLLQRTLPPQSATKTATTGNVWKFQRGRRPVRQAYLPDGPIRPRSRRESLTAIQMPDLVCSNCCESYSRGRWDQERRTRCASPPVFGSATKLPQHTRAAPGSNRVGRRRRYHRIVTRKARGFTPPTSQDRARNRHASADLCDVCGSAQRCWDVRQDEKRHLGASSGNRGTSANAAGAPAGRARGESGRRPVARGPVCRGAAIARTEFKPSKPQPFR
jgi:hypothetical protein